MTRKKKTKAQTGPETEPTELTPEVAGQPEQPETLPVSVPEPADQPEIEAEAVATPMTGDEAETPRDKEPSAGIETIETETDEIVGDDALEKFDGEENVTEPEPSGVEIVSVSFDSPVAPSDEEPEMETSLETEEIAEKGSETVPENETPVVESPSEPVAKPQPPEAESPETETNETVEAESEPGEVRSEEGETPAPPTDAEVQALDFQAAFRRAFQQPEDEELEAEPLEIEQETADVEDISGEPLARTPAQIKAAVECLLFTTPSPLGAKRMANIIGGIDLRTMRGILGQLQAEYDTRGSGIQIIESAEGFQMCTRPEHATAIMQLHRQRKKNPLSPTALETLAIVAYKQPLTRAEIEMIRGVECSGVVRNLCDLDLIKVVGRKEVIGRPQIYGTTARFLQTFGLKAIEELPSIQNLRRRYALDDDESGKPTSVQDLIQAQANRAAMGKVDAESQPDETPSEERQESEEAGTNASGETPMPQNRPPLDDEEDADLREDRGDDASEETGDAPDAPEEDIPEEDEAEMDEAEETFIADEEDEADEDEGWDDGKDDGEEEDDTEANEDREDEDEEADGADTDTPEETDEDDSEGNEDDMNDWDDEEEDDEEDLDEEDEDEDDEDWDEDDEDEDDEDEEEDEEEDDD